MATGGKGSSVDEGGLGDSLDWILYFGISAILGLIVGAIVWFKDRSPKGRVRVEQEAAAQAQGAPQPPRRRQPGLRNRRGGRRAQAHGHDDSDSGEQEDPNESGGSSSDEEDRLLLDNPKLGAKKRAKLEAKIEKRQQRKIEERSRQEKKERELKMEEEKKRDELKLEETEKRKEEEEKRRIEEKEKRELEEYMKLKESFIVEEEGCDVLDTEIEEDLLGKFISHVKEKKVILFEELAAQFNLKVPDAIQRLNTLVTEGRLTGVMDDRGKFIYISEEELGTFAKFIKQRGRVSIAELIENSSSIIKAEPKPEVSSI